MTDVIHWYRNAQNLSSCLVRTYSHHANYGRNSFGRRSYHYSSTRNSVCAGRPSPDERESNFNRVTKWASHQRKPNAAIHKANKQWADDRQSKHPQATKRKRCRRHGHTSRLPDTGESRRPSSEQKAEEENATSKQYLIKFLKLNVLYRTAVSSTPNKTCCW